MLSTHRKLNGLMAAMAIAAAVAIMAAAPANAARAQEQTCAGAPTWTTVIDEQGVPNLQQTSGTRCTSSLACATTTDTATASPYQGWVNVTDDTGVPWLYPANQFRATRQLACSTPEAPDTSPSAATTTTATPTSPIIHSPYGGWVIVTDENGVPFLYPSNEAHP
jgi:hypothetical protein